MPGTIDLPLSGGSKTQDGGNVIGNPNAYDQAAGNQYQDFHINTAYDYDPGILVLPVAKADGTPGVEVVRLHGGFGTRRVNFGGRKTGSPLVLPAAADTDKDLLISATVVTPLPSPNPQNGQYTWTAEGEYIFVTADDVNGPRIPGVHHLPTGQYPYPLPTQDAVAESIGDGTPGSIEKLADDLRDDNSGNDIPSNEYVWPFTLYPAAFFNPLLLRED
jgi:hypothetical protein